MLTTEPKISKTEPKARFILRLCRNMSCNLAGKEDVAQQLRKDLEIQFGETTPDGSFTLAWSDCFHLCDQGPALTVNDDVYTKVTSASAHHIVECCRRNFRAFARNAQRSSR